MSTEAVVDVGPVAHGGHCVARLDGQVVFVRHALPGERVRISITERTKTFLRADAVEVLDAAPGRVDAPCRYAGTCGGCDFQHVDPAVQRELLADVVREQRADWRGSRGTASWRPSRRRHWVGARGCSSQSTARAVQDCGGIVRTRSSR
ncbi:TRAM domain-containing protein [Aeromicrobium sp. UC242_57]|uniref:TRAM domain-containing protein n=1 Tax=Aeromicrobium sp. UC242_57 TaxID=3374624 RepID=UPI0037B1D99C